LVGKTALLAAGLVALLGFAAIAAIAHQKSRESGIVLRVYLCSAAQKPWKELVKLFEEETGIRVEAVYGSSGHLLAQLRMAGGDVYAPAAPFYMEKAVEEGLVDPSTVRKVVLLYPVILVPKGNPAGISSLEDLARPGVRVGIGEPEHVAVGRYARQLLEEAGLWEKVKHNIVVYAKNVAELTNYVAMGAIDAAIVWDVNHWWYPNRTEMVPIPEKYWKHIGPSYVPIAVATGSKHREEALRFIEFVTENPLALKVWESYHYHPAGAAER
jgi:molybdate transport system substrate-binding protein